MLSHHYVVEQSASGKGTTQLNKQKIVPTTPFHDLIVVLNSGDRRI